MPGFLYQIEDRQRKFTEAHVRNQGSRLLTALRVAQRQSKEIRMKDKMKIIGVAVPESVHKHMEEFIERHKSDATLPKSKKALALACIIKAMDDDSRGSPVALDLSVLASDDNYPSMDEPPKAY